MFVDEAEISKPKRNASDDKTGSQQNAGDAPTKGLCGNEEACPWNDVPAYLEVHRETTDKYWQLGLNSIRIRSNITYSTS